MRKVLEDYSGPILCMLSKSNLREQALEYYRKYLVSSFQKCQGILKHVKLKKHLHSG